MYSVRVRRSGGRPSWVVVLLRAPWEDAMARQPRQYPEAYRPGWAGRSRPMGMGRRLPANQREDCRLAMRRSRRRVHLRAGRPGLCRRGRVPFPFRPASGRIWVRASVGDSATRYVGLARLDGARSGCRGRCAPGPWPAETDVVALRRHPTDWVPSSAPSRRRHGRRGQPPRPARASRWQQLSEHRGSLFPVPTASSRLAGQVEARRTEKFCQMSTR